MFKRKYLFIVLLSIGLTSPVYVISDDPDQTIKGFYQHIANHDCEKAVELADGYSIQRCRSVKNLKLSEVEKVEQQANLVLFKIILSYQRIQPSKTITDQRDYARVPVIRKNNKWLVDFYNISTSATVSTPAKHSDSNAGSSSEASKNLQVHDAPQQSDSQLVHGRKLLETDTSMPPVTDQAAQTGKAGEIKQPTLLAMWKPYELRGQPGDERIINLKPPNHDPPQYTQPKEKLPKLDSLRYDSIRRIRLPEDKKLIALTFDLCEQADDRTGYDRGIVNVLREQQVPATFFAGGKWLRSHEDKALQLMADPLFEIGNHGWTHGNLRVLKGQRMRDQIVWTQAEYERIWDILDSKAKRFGMEQQMEQIPRQPRTLRFPYGTCNAESLRATNELGLSAIQWDVVSGDAASGISADALARRVIGVARSGSIVVFHANGRGSGSAAALPGIVNALEDKGFGFVTVSKLLEQGTPETAKECYELRPGDNRRYDALFGEGTE